MTFQSKNKIKIKKKEEEEEISDFIMLWFPCL